MTYLIPLIIIGALAVVYFVYMKFYFPKFKEQYAQIDKEFNQEWNNNKEEILSEYFTDPNRFGLISDVTQGEKIIGMLSVGSLPKSFKTNLKDAVVGAITLTQKVDMSQYYLVATDKGLHYTGFDGERCFVHEVFDYNQIIEKKLTDKLFSFVYKNEKISLKTNNISIDGYPRFIVHERDKTPTSNNRAINYFVREYLAYEQTDNMEFKHSNNIIPRLDTSMLKASKERIKDLKIRQYLIEQFKKKLGILN